MEYHLELRKDSKDPQTHGSTEKIMSPRTSGSIKLSDRFKAEKPSLSYAHFHHEIIKSSDDLPPKPSGNVQKKQTGRKPNEDDELVKFMSNLPSYLERGEKLQEKVLNVGVLDWGRLEKWQCNHKQVPCRSDRCSPSSSNTSSFFSTDESSTHSSRGHSCSPGRHRMHRSTLQSHLEASPQEGYFQDAKSFGGDVGKFEDLKATQSNSLNGQQKLHSTDQSFYKNQSQIKLEMGNSSILKNHSKETMKTQNGECAKTGEKSDKLNSSVVDQDYPERHNTVVLLLPRDIPQNSSAGASQFSDSTTITGRASTEASRRSFTERSYSKQVHHSKLYSDNPLSFPLPCDTDNRKYVQMKQRNSVDSLSSDTSRTFPPSAKMSMSPSRGRSPEKKKYISSPTNSTTETAKVRNASPIRRFSMAMGRISKIACTKEGPALPQLSSAHVNAISDSEVDMSSGCLDKSNGDKPTTTNRSRSSPLRRLLDPLLKPKAAESASVNKSCKSFDGQLDSSTAHSAKVKLDLMTCRSVTVNDSCQSGKQGRPASAVQALLQVAVKNGLPLFTFAVDNNSDILAATMRKVSTSRKDDESFVYTFFTIRGVKKKSWINQGGKGKSHNYVPNVVAQMKVSASQSSNMISMREFVLFAVDSRQGDQQMSNDELAAIVLKIPKSFNRDGEDLHNQYFVESEDGCSATVILPSEVHSLPSKGEPSSLIERWISGGVCDCGGWDLGCKLRVLGNRKALKKGSTMNEFELFSQGGGIEENQPIFSLAPFKDGIYSVEFNSSLTLLQSFSICIAVLNSRKASVEVTEPSNSSEGKTCDQVQVEVPARYVPYPPHSPVGRV